MFQPKMTYKLWLVLSALVFLGIRYKAQPADKIYGLCWKNNQASFGSYDITAKYFTPVSLLNGSFTIQSGESTYDDASGHYFIKSSVGILMIDVLSGLVLDTLKPAQDLHGIEFDSRINSLVGSYTSGNVEIFARLKINTKVFTSVDTLPKVLGIQSGESTFDQVLRRYFAINNRGIMVVDSNGLLIDTINPQFGFRGMEYDPASDKLVGTHYKPGFELSACIAVSTKSFTALDTLFGAIGMAQGETSFDKINRRYFTKTSQTILNLSAQNGKVLDTLKNLNQLSGIEFAYVTLVNTVGLKEVKNEIQTLPYPNPSRGFIQMDHLKFGDLISITDVNGKEIFKASCTSTKLQVNLTGNKPGLYFYSIRSNGSLLKGKLVLASEN